MTKQPRPPARVLPSPSLADDILQAVQAIVMVGNGEGQVIYASPAVERLLGYRVEEVLGDSWWKLECPEPGKSTSRREEIARMARGEIPVPQAPYTSCVRTGTGEERWILWNVAKGPADLIIQAGQDITLVQKAKQQVTQREQDFSAIFDGATDGLLILDSNWIYTHVNTAAARIIGLSASEIVGKPHGTLAQPSVDMDAFRKEAMSKGSVRAEIELIRHDGEKRQMEYTLTTNFRAGFHLVIMHDITDRKVLEQQLGQAQRLEAVGRLAGGIAHDFNNMLTAIRGYGDLLLKKYPEGPHRRYVEGILNASDRAAQTTAQLLAFSRRQVMQPRLLDLNEAVTDLLQLLRRMIGEDIELVTLLSEDTGKVLVDPSQFGQILMNLAVNARDAMPGGGKLIIETRSVYLNDEYVLKHIQVEAGEYAMLAVTDTGTGIPTEIRPHIFEPFFTTKPQGEGSGLGLATVYGIVKQSGGYVWVYSEPGEGTTFKIYFPKPAGSLAPAGNSMRQQEVILLIEDDELIRSLAATVLREKGYVIYEARDGRQALDLCQKHNMRLDLVITDVGAPGMSGEDLMGYFAMKYPQVAILHMSGFSERYLHDTHSVPQSSLFLGKPFTVQQLLEKVQEALEKNHKPSPA